MKLFDMPMRAGRLRPQCSAIVRGAVMIAAAIALPGMQPFKVTVVDEETGRGVPLVCLTTVHHVQFVTDSAGVAAIDAAELMHREAYFEIKSSGYEYQPDGFGFHGVRLTPRPGDAATIRIKRLNLAERLYRITGAGIYADSVRCGDEVPIPHPLLNAGVLGQDSVQSAIYRGRLYCFYGDTSMANYPLGIFHGTGGTAALPKDGRSDPAVCLALEYFQRPDGRAKPIAEMAGEGPTWINGPIVIGDSPSEQRMYATYAKIKPPLDAYRRGLCQWNDEAQRFEPVSVYPDDTPICLEGHLNEQQVEGQKYLSLGRPFPLIRFPATDQALRDIDSFEAFTCLAAGSDLKSPKIDRSDDGRVRYRWRKQTAAVEPMDQPKLIRQKLLAEHEQLFQLRDRDSGKAVMVHRGNVSWNEYRNRWIAIFTEINGSSPLGEIWYSEADSQLGPWVDAVKVVTHDAYSFYNPKHHVYFDAEGGMRIHFEGTYTHTFSGNPRPTPRYDYNQIMYRLDLTTPQVALPVAVRFEENRWLLGAGEEVETWSDIAFFACDRPGSKTVPVYLVNGRLSLRASGEPVFHALPTVDGKKHSAAVPLNAFRNDRTGEWRYSTDETIAEAGFTAAGDAGFYVWRNPYREAE